MEKRKIAIFTGSRSEYGILYPIIKAIAADPMLEYYLIVSGSHLDEDYGQTASEIEKDGFRIYKKIRLKNICEFSNIFDNIDSFIIKESDTLRTGMQKINENKWGIIFIVDSQNKIKGAATDGDIRRAILQDVDINTRISDIMNKNILYLKPPVDIQKISDVLNSEESRIKISGSIILPVINDNGRIIDLIYANRDSLYRTTNEIADIITKLSDILSDLKPTFLVIYGDRYESFAAAICGTQMMIPTVHIEGGDITGGGTLDEPIRHAITKLAHIHLTTNEESYKRVLRSGEESCKVYNIGYPIFDLIKEGNFASPKEIEEKFKIDVHKSLVVFIQHSVSTEFAIASDQIQPSLDAMESLAGEGINIVMIYPNNDAGSKVIINKIQEMESKNIQNINITKSLSRYFYHGLLNICGNTGRGVSVGNSSSGIKETPAFGCPTVNIGSRQHGRLRAQNVIDVDYNMEEIIHAVKKCIFDDDFRNYCKHCENPYRSDNAGNKTAEILATIELNSSLIQKKITI